MTLFARWEAALEQLSAQGRLRQFALPQGLDFTSNDYLGNGAQSGAPISPELSRSGLASRLLRGHHAIWEQVESQLAQWHGAESALMLTSGYAANEGLISTIMEPGDWVATDELNHACIVDGLRLAKSRRFAFRHNDLAHLEEGLKTEVARNDPDRQRFIVTESLFSMDGDCAPLGAMAELATTYNAYLIVDEAHSTGCFGVNGSGLVDQAGIRAQVLASMHTGGKGLGLPGAYLVTSNLLRSYLINRCRHLIFTTALPAAVGSWWSEALPRIQADESRRQQLHRNAVHFREELNRHKVEALGDQYIVPVIVGDDKRAVEAAKKLQACGFDVRAIRPPTVAPGTSRLRISVHANHDFVTLSRLAEAIADAVKHE